MSYRYNSWMQQWCEWYFIVFIHQHTTFPAHYIFTALPHYTDRANQRLFYLLIRSPTLDSATTHFDDLGFHHRHRLSIIELHVWHVVRSPEEKHTPLSNEPRLWCVSRVRLSQNASLKWCNQMDILNKWIRKKRTILTQPVCIHCLLRVVFIYVIDDVIVEISKQAAHLFSEKLEQMNVC